MNFTITRKSRFWAEKRQGSDVTDSQTDPSQTDHLLRTASLETTSPLKPEHNSRIDQSLLTRTDLAESKSLVDNSSSPTSRSDMLKFNQSPVPNSKEPLRGVRKQFQTIVQFSGHNSDVNESRRKRELKRPSALHFRKPYFFGFNDQLEGIPVVPEEEKEHIRSQSVSEDDYSYYDDNVSSAYSASCADEDDYDPDDDEENMDPMRQLRRRRLRKIFYATYFVGVAISLQNRIRLYGTLKPIESVKKLQPETNALKKNRFSPLMPSDPIRICWTIILAFFSFVTAIITPYQISFIQDENDTLLYVTNVILDVAFGIDIIANFISAYYDPLHGLITDTKTIRSQYFNWWFWFDLISMIPLHLAIPSISSFRRVNKLLRLSHMSRLSRWFKLLRLFNMLKLSSTSKTFKKIFKRIHLNPDVKKMLKFVFNIAILNHIAGCFLFFLARLDGFAPDTWVSKGRLVDEAPFSQYLVAYSWALQTITTVGFGDIEPGTPLERLTAIIWMIMGVGVYSITYENLSLILINKDMRESALKRKISEFNNFASKTKLPEFLRKKVQRFFELNHKENVYYWLNPNDILKHLPEGLKGTLLLYSYHTMIKNIKILDMNANFTAALLLHLRLLKLEKRELLYREGDPSQEIYFISKGSIKMVNEFGQGIYTLIKGTYFGELEILQDTKRRCFAQACEITIIIVCDKEIFLETLKSFPDIAEQLKKVAKYREDKLQTTLTKLKAEAPENILKGNKKPLLNCSAYFEVLLGEKNKVKKRQRPFQKKEKEATPKTNIKQNIISFLTKTPKTPPKEIGQEKSFEKLSNLAISLRKHKSDDKNSSEGNEQIKRFIKRSGIKKSYDQNQGPLDPSESQTNNSSSQKTESQPITLNDVEQKQITEEIKKGHKRAKSENVEQNTSRFTQAVNQVELDSNSQFLAQNKSNEETNIAQSNQAMTSKRRVNLPPINLKVHLLASNSNRLDQEGIIKESPHFSTELKMSPDIIEEPNSARKFEGADQEDNPKALLQQTDKINNIQKVQKGLGEIRKLREITESILSQIGVKEENVIAEFNAIAERQQKLNANVEKLFSMFKKAT